VSALDRLGHHCGHGLLPVAGGAAANQRLLNLAFRHPNAYVDHNRADCLAAEARLLKGS
jgi:hypothetical protein